MLDEINIWSFLGFKKHFQLKHRPCSSKKFQEFLSDFKKYLENDRNYDLSLGELPRNLTTAITQITLEAIVLFILLCLH